MILRRLLTTVVAATSIATAAAIALVALAGAIFALLLPHVGAAYAAAIVAAVFALLVGLAGLLAMRGSGGFNLSGGGRVDEREAMGLAERLMELARERPVAAVGVALALGIVLMRSPNALGAIARAFFDSFGGLSGFGGRPEER